MTRLVALAIAALAVAPAQDARKWAEAMGSFQKYAGSRDPLDRARAAEDVGNATFEKHDKTCWGLVSGLLRQELQKEGQGGKSEEKVSGDVVEACLGALKKITHKDVLAEMTRVAKAKGEVLRVRIYVIWALAARGELKDLAELAEDKIPQIQVAAVDALVERADKSCADLFLKLLADEKRLWEVKLGALQGLEKSGTEAQIEPLIEGLGKCRADEGRLKDQYLKSLQKLTGLELDSDDPNAWKAAWTAKKAGDEIPKGTTMTEPTEFYGLKTRSTRLVFVLDRTGSMMAPGSEPTRTVFKLPPDAAGAPKEPPQEAKAREEATRLKKKWDETKVATRMDVAKKEFINTVYVLHPRVHFNVIWYEGNPHPWKQELVPATWANKLECIKDADKLSASGPTNIWDALETAFKMTEMPQRPDVIQIDKKANYATAVGGADTFFLMTDGQPNEGRISKTDEIISELRKVNRLRKVTLHTICVGDLLPGVPATAQENPDPRFLKKIADENGGDFVHLKK